MSLLLKEDDHGERPWSLAIEDSTQNDSPMESEDRFDMYPSASLKTLDCISHKGWEL